MATMLARWRARPARQRRVLLIEDNPDEAYLIRAMLSESVNHVYEVDQESRLGDGVERLRQGGHYDAVLLDLSLPDSSAAATVDAIAPLARTAPVIVLTGHDNRALIRDAVAHGAGDVLNKNDVVGLRLSLAIELACRRQAQRDRLGGPSYHDALTDVFNRRGFEAVADEYSAAVCAGGGCVRVAYADIDSLRSINDAYGSEMGDRAIGEAAAILIETFRQLDVVARWGEDEFVVLLVNPQGVPDAVLRERLSSVLARHNRKRDLPYDLQLSLGLSPPSRGERQSIAQLVDAAAKAMHADKALRVADQTWH